MNKITITQEQLEQIIRMAFQHGESWGVCYQGWFMPTKQDTEKRVMECLEKVDTRIKNFK